MNILLWENNFEFIFELSKLEDIHKTKFLLHMVNPSVLTKLQEKCAPDKPDKFSYDELMSILEKTYSFHHGRRAIDYRYMYRTQLPNEPVKRYVRELRELFSRASFPVRLVNNIQHRFIQGLQDEEVKTLLKEKENISFATAICIARKIEFAKKNKTGESTSQ
ncbi:hypothetical protein M0804_013260 [Polistes exclamans]|nr:hypothetical protein M0804_013260 [Polistes exclamans]